VKFISDSTVIACRAVAEAFDDELQIHGLSAGEWASLFGAGRSRPDWASVADRGPIRIGRRNDGPASDQSGKERRLDDGRVALSSNAAGLAWIEPDADRHNLLLPQALHLLLTQQWARAGLMPVHACAFSIAGQGILALGDRGAGKSSLVLAALAAGARIVSDDWMLLGLDTDQVIQAERLREFLMLRPGPVVEQFSGVLSADLTTSGDGRLVWSIEAGDPRFPVSLSIDQCWWLNSPAADRPDKTASRPLVQSTMLAHLVGAAMPLLLTPEFSHEQITLLSTLKRIVHQADCIELVSGRDLLDQPMATIERTLNTNQA